MKCCPESYLYPETNCHHVSGVSATILIGRQAHLNTRNQSADVLLICVWRLSRGRQVTGPNGRQGHVWHHYYYTNIQFHH